MTASADAGSGWEVLRASLVARGGGERRRSVRAPRPVERRAAVAAILRAPADPELLLIRRAEHPEDPWSGHMAFPGGRVDPGDAGPLAAALRETDEEIGLDLDSRGALLGELPQVPVIGGGRRLPLAIHPFVFGIPDPAVSFELNHEVEEALWIPLAYLADRANRSSFVWEGRGARVHMPACDYGDRRIWGLTLRMIEDLLLVVGP